MSPHNFIEKLSAFKDVHDEVEALTILIHFVQLHYVLVVHLLHNVDLSLEPLNLLRVINRPFLDDLDCPFEVAYLVDTPAHLAERTLTQLL